MVRLIRALCGHPDAGGLWEAHLKKLPKQLRELDPRLKLRAEERLNIGFYRISGAFVLGYTHMLGRHSSLVPKWGWPPAPGTHCGCTGFILRAVPPEHDAPFHFLKVLRKFKELDACDRRELAEMHLPNLHSGSRIGLPGCPKLLPPQDPQSSMEESSSPWTK